MFNMPLCSKTPIKTIVAALIGTWLCASTAWANSVILDKTTESLELQTASTASTDYSVSFVDKQNAQGSANGNIAAATTTTILVAPPTLTPRQVTWISIRNRDGAASQTVTLKLDVSATEFHLTPAVVLEAGESMIVDAEGNFIVYTAAGLVKAPSAGSAYATIQEEGSSLTQRTTLNFIGSAVTCVDNAGKTECTVTGGSGLTHDQVQMRVGMGY